MPSLRSFSNVGGLDLGNKRCNLDFDRFSCCCLAVLAHQRVGSVTPVNDDKPLSSPPREVESSTAIDKVQDDSDALSTSAFHKDLNLLPKPLSATDLSCSQDDGGKVRVAYQGIAGAYSEAAVLKAHPNCETVPCEHFEAAFKAVELWLVDKAVLPIENSVGGSIHRNYDLFLRHRLHIVGEVQMPVNHCLLGLPGVRKEELKQVLSHPQALFHCEQALTKLGVQRVSTDDTAGAAQMVATGGFREIGAIESARAAGIYGLNIIAEKIQDDDDNVTRFLILAREPIIPRTDKCYKTSIVFTLDEGPGVLFKALCHAPLNCPSPLTETSLDVGVTLGKLRVNHAMNAWKCAKTACRRNEPAFMASPQARPACPAACEPARLPKCQRAWHACQHAQLRASMSGMPASTLCCEAARPVCLPARQLAQPACMHARQHEILMRKTLEGLRMGWSIGEKSRNMPRQRRWQRTL